MGYRVLSGSSRELGSPARTKAAERTPTRIAAVQLRWHPDPTEHREAIEAGIRLAAAEGARVVCLPELTLSPYFAISEELIARRDEFAEPIPAGPTTRLARELATEHGIGLHASLYERAEDGGLGYNTAICVGPDGDLLVRTRKIHIPAFPGYHENLCFRPGEPSFDVVELAGARFGFPTCWDQGFPELARIYSLAGAEILVYPSAIGNEPSNKNLDTRPLWEHLVTANGLANATFMVVVNRIGTEHDVTFYGSSFISDPYGRVVVQAPEDEPAVIVAELDLDQRRDWLGFGLLEGRRPEVYRPLTIASHLAVAP